MNSIVKFCVRIILLLVLLPACAPPAPEFSKQDFVSAPEVIGASIFNEGLTYLKSGRFIDAVMSFSKAEFLFPKAENIKANLALAFKGAELYDQSISIYSSLIQKNPKYLDYQYALADTYFRAGKVAEALNAYKKVMLDYEANNETAKAAIVARTLSTVMFQIGDEAGAKCYSNSSEMYFPAQDAALSHARLLIAMGEYQDAAGIVDPVIQANASTKDIAILKLAALSKVGNGDLEQALKYIDLAVEHNAANGDPDPELTGLSMVLTELAPAIENDEKENADEEKELLPVLRPAVTLYWPPKLVAKYENMKELEEKK